MLLRPIDVRSWCGNLFSPTARLQHPAMPGLHLAHALFSGAAMSLVSLRGLVARVVAAALEGVTFIFSRQGRHMLLVAELAAFAVVSGGPSRPARVGLRAALAIAAGRTLYTLAHSLHNMPHSENLTSVWDWCAAQSSRLEGGLRSAGEPLRAGGLSRAGRGSSLTVSLPLWAPDITAGSQMRDCRLMHGTCCAPSSAQPSRSSGGQRLRCRCCCRPLPPASTSSLMALCPER